MKQSCKRYSLLFFLCSLGLGFAKAQTVQTFVDRNKILIGEPIQLKIITKHAPNTTSLKWFNLPDSIPHFEWIEQGKIDTVNDNGQLKLQQILTITSFDSGKYYTPSFSILSTDIQTNKTKKIGIDSIAIDVGYAVEDSTKQIRDIKPIISVEDKSNWWYYIIGGLILLLLTMVIISKLLKKKVNLKIVNKEDAYKIAMQSLQKLNIKNYSVKEFHVELSQIFKQYISQTQLPNAFKLTTDETLVYLKDKLSSTKFSETSSALRSSDAVKFAKYLPTNDDSETCLQIIKSVIENLHQTKAN